MTFQVVGKTYISAFDAVRFGAKRVLFIAHREEILIQAMETFVSVNPKASCGVFNAEFKNTGSDYIFASVQTIGKVNFLTDSFFSKDHFDYIVMDEFHHAAADRYKAILEYFTPKFLLGLTATPYRMDNKDLLSLCDDNIVYELDLVTTINRGILCPFKYYAVYDVVDYDGIGLANGKYRVDELEKAYQLGMRQQIVLDKFKQYGGKRTLGFCISIKHADDMAEFFVRNKINAVALHSGADSGEGSASRKDILAQFRNGVIPVLFVVDVLNEGVDIPEIDAVMFLRPTESYVIFLQQLGRGLRKDSSKKFLNVIDFIGNYKKAHYKPLLLSGVNPLTGRGLRAGGGGTGDFARKHADILYPEGCSVQFDLRIIDMFEEMAKRDPLKIRLRDEFVRLTGELGRRPDRFDLLTGSDIPVGEFMKSGYLHFLDSMGALDAQELAWIGTSVETFLMRMEKTGMQRYYKLPVLLSIIENNGSVNYETIGSVFRDFYMLNKQHQWDLRNDKKNKNFENWGSKEFLFLALENPVKFLAKTEHEFIKHDEVNKRVYFADEIMNCWNNQLKMHLFDIVKVRENQHRARKYIDESKGAGMYEQR